MAKTWFVLPVVISVLLLGVSCSAIRQAVGCDASSVSHLDLIEWVEEPSIDTDGYMSMSGRTKGGAKIRAPGDFAVFNFNNFREVEGSNVEKAVGGGQLKALGGIVPPMWPGTDDSNVRADEWDVSPDRFRVRLLVPEHMKSDDITLVLLVWGEDLEEGALGLACVRTEG